MIEEKLIRHALLERLLGRTAAGAQVTTNRAFAWRKNRDQPGIAIYTLTSTAEPYGSGAGGRTHRWELELAIEMYVRQGKGGDIPDDQCSDLANEIQALIEADRYLGLDEGDQVELLDARPVSYDVDTDAEGQQLIGGARLTWVWIFIRTEHQGDPEQLTPLEQIYVETDLRADGGGPAGEAVDATDVVDLPQV